MEKHFLMAWGTGAVTKKNGLKQKKKKRRENMEVNTEGDLKLSLRFN